MSKYLLEVGVEELPYKFIPMAISQLKNGFETFLNDNNVKYEKVNVMATPRRLAVIVDGLASSQPDVEKVVKAVSYTHLDVYKRQKKSYLHSIVSVFPNAGCIFLRNLFYIIYYEFRLGLKEIHLNIL